MIGETIIVVLTVILFFVFIIGGYMISSYNLFVRLKQDIKNQFSNIKTEYQRRADLFINLVESVKSHKKFEKETLVEVIAMRSGLNSASKGEFGKGKSSQIKKLGMLDGLFNGLKITLERYPELKSIEQFNRLFEEVRITEDRINVARTDYNGIVKDYNVSIKEFPKKILADMFRFEKEDYFKNEPKSDESPKIQLD